MTTPPSKKRAITEVEVDKPKEVYVVIREATPTGRSRAVLGVYTDIAEARKVAAAARYLKLKDGRSLQVGVVIDVAEFHAN